MKCILAAVAAVIVGHAAAQPKPDVSLLQYSGPDRDRKMLAAAKKEGALTLYTTIAEKDLPVIVGRFEKKYGIKVNIWRGAQALGWGSARGSFRGRRDWAIAQSGRYHAGCRAFGA